MQDCVGLNSYGPGVLWNLLDTRYPKHIVASSLHLLWKLCCKLLLYKEGSCCQTSFQDCINAMCVCICMYCWAPVCMLYLVVLWEIHSILVSEEEIILFHLWRSYNSRKISVLPDHVVVYAECVFRNDLSDLVKWDWGASTVLPFVTCAKVFLILQREKERCFSLHVDKDIYFLYSFMIYNRFAP